MNLAMNEYDQSMKEFSKITNPADVLDGQHFLQLNKIFLMHQNDNNQTNICMRGQLLTLRLTTFWSLDFFDFFRNGVMSLLCFIRREWLYSLLV